MGSLLLVYMVAYIIPGGRSRATKQRILPLFLLNRALQRVLVLPREIHHLGYLGLGDFIGIDAADADAATVNV
jgi:hypothetical protein